MQALDEVMGIFEFLRALLGAVGSAAGDVAGLWAGLVAGEPAFMFLQRLGWHINNAPDINRKKVCLSFVIVFLKHI